MKAIGIICEYNPFHNGHAHQLHTLSNTHPDAVRIAIMSGSFVQRGEPAYFSKFDRARWAIYGGADVVIELPTVYSLGSAELFCTGAIRLMKALHIDSISFGSELNDNSVLHEAAKFLNTQQGQDAIQRQVRTGVSYGTALRQVIAEHVCNGELINSAPNALLGLEYIRAAQQYFNDLSVVPIVRQSSHHSPLLPHDQDFPSGTALREALIQGKEIYSYVPASIINDVNRVIKSGAYTDYERYIDMLHGINRLLSTIELETYGDFTEGIEYRWHQAMQQSNWSDALEEIKTKRYTYARLRRMAAYTALHITKSILQEAHMLGPQYARLLAFNQRGRTWLKHKTPTIPLIQKWAKAPSMLSNCGKQMLFIDTKATDLQAYVFKSPAARIGHEDFRYSPQYIET
mgnify:FL=1